LKSFSKPGNVNKEKQNETFTSLALAYL